MKNETLLTSSCFVIATRRYIGVMIIATMATLTGCEWTRSALTSNSNFLRGQQQALSPEAELPEIVEHLNRPCYQVKGWQSTDASIHVSGIPVSLKAMIAVEEPKNARLVVSNPLGQHEFQAGSNPVGVWSWEKRDEQKRIITVSHEEVPQMILESGLPFSPDWLLQIVGLTPYDATNLKLERNSADPNNVKLIEMVNNNGVYMKKVTTVDLQKGVVTGHDLYDPRGTWLVSARISDYRKTDVEGIVMPVQYELRIPNAKQGMTIKLATLEVNPDFTDNSLWAIPNIGECQVVALHPRGSSFPPVPSRLSRDNLNDGLYQQQQLAWEYDLTDPQNPKTKQHVISHGKTETNPVRTAEGGAGVAQFDLLSQDAAATQPWQQQNQPPASMPPQTSVQPAAGHSDGFEWAR